MGNEEGKSSAPPDKPPDPNRPNTNAPPAVPPARGIIADGKETKPTRRVKLQETITVKDHDGDTFVDTPNTTNRVLLDDSSSSSSDDDESDSSSGDSNSEAVFIKGLEENVQTSDKTPPPSSVTNRDKVRMNPVARLVNLANDKTAKKARKSHRRDPEGGSYDARRRLMVHEEIYRRGGYIIDEYGKRRKIEPNTPLPAKLTRRAPAPKPKKDKKKKRKSKTPTKDPK